MLQALLFALCSLQAPAVPPAPAQAPESAPAIDPALAAFRRMCDRIDLGQALPPIAAFRLNIAIERREDGQVNGGTAQLSWRTPNFVRLVLENGRQQARGPDGYWMKDSAEAPVEKLVGRDNADSRREIDEIAAMCHNFAALARAREWKLSKLSALAAPPSELPHALRETASTLEWLELASPDFKLLDDTAPGAAVASGPKQYRVRVGLVRADSKLPAGRKVEPGAPFLLLIGEQRDGIDILGTQMLLALDALRPLDREKPNEGPRVPSRMYLRRADPFSRSGAFEEAPSIEIGIAAGSRVGIELADAEFAP